LRPESHATVSGSPGAVHYRAKLYDLLETRHPEAFDNSDDEACRRGSEVMRRFLRQQLLKDNIKLNGDGFEMLCHDFFCSCHFYDRAEKIRKVSKPDDA
jgi:hypothetical protein